MSENSSGLGAEVEVAMTYVDATQERETIRFVSEEGRLMVDPMR